MNQAAKHSSLIRLFAAGAAVAALAACSSSSSGDDTGAAGSTGTAGTTGSGGTSSAGGSAGAPAVLGPGATLKCTSSGKNAYDTYGTAFGTVNDSIFTNVNAEITKNGNANLGDSFTKIGSGNPVATKDDAATFKGRLAAFLIFAYGGPNTYDGEDMTTAHTGLGITSDQYDYFVTNIVVPALTGNGVPTDDVSSCFAPPLVDPNFKASIVGK